jgi:regulator of protease activity HflC (stomatin/prohibitin superfamily)
VKRVRINKQKIGLVYRNGDFQRILLAGSHWLRFSDEVKMYNQSQLYATLPDMELAMEDDVFKHNIVQINLKENEIALMYVRDNFSDLLKSGNYFYFKGSVDIKVDVFDFNSVDEITSIDQAILKNHSVAHYVTTFKLESYEKGLLFQNGRYVKELSSGSYSFWYGTYSLEMMKVDLRTTQIELSGQELLTKDKAAVRLNFQLEYRVVDIQKALLENTNFAKQLYTKGQLSMREIVGSLTLDELLDSKEKVGDFVMNSLKVNSAKLGIEVSQAGIRDIILPGEVKDIMNQVLIAEKKAQANAIMRREETASTRTMLNTAKLMEDNSILLRLKEMEYIEKIAGKIGEIKLSNGGSMADQLSKILT